MPVNNVEETVVVTIAKALQLAGTICEVVCFGDGARLFYSSTMTINTNADHL
jgi:hypothetical protein